MNFDRTLDLLDNMRNTVLEESEESRYNLTQYSKRYRFSIDSSEVEPAMSSILKKLSNTHGVMHTRDNIVLPVHYLSSIIATTESVKKVPLQFVATLSVVHLTNDGGGKTLPEGHALAVQAIEIAMKPMGWKTGCSKHIQHLGQGPCVVMWWLAKKMGRFGIEAGPSLLYLQAPTALVEFCYFVV